MIVPRRMHQAMKRQRLCSHFARYSELGAHHCNMATFVAAEADMNMIGKIALTIFTTLNTALLGSCPACNLLVRLGHLQPAFLRNICSCLSGNYLLVSLQQSFLLGLPRKEGRRIYSSLAASKADRME